MSRGGALASRGGRALLGAAMAGWLGALAAGAAQAETLGPGNSLPPLAFEDQHGEGHALHAELRALIFTRDMDAGRVVREALDEEGSALLERHAAVYVADVSRMPAIIRRTMAIPRMRSRPYPVLLDTRGEATAAFPGEAGQVTVLLLDRLRVADVRLVDSAEALHAALAEAASADDPQ